ncbi:MAG TPA: MATE family efflux transporter, partial [Ruminococcaceae bacterium]|nr:MATE family efflux transporter [Oscillospiraceae bacterium]
RRTRRVGMMVSLFLATCFVLFSHQIVALYNNDPEIVSLGGTILMFIAFIQPFQASQFILAGVLRGAGDTRATAVITFMTVLLVRPGLAILMIYGFHLGLPGAWVALAADQLLRSLLVWIRYRTGKWKTIKV